IIGYQTCTYFMALEGWRRGLELTFNIKPGIAISQGISFTLSNGTRTHEFKVSRGDKVTNKAISICQQKPKTYKYLRKNNVPIPEGDWFTIDVLDEEIIEYADKLGYPLVLKP